MERFTAGAYGIFVAAVGICGANASSSAKSAPDSMSSQQAKMAVEARAFPLFIHDPRKGEKLRERLSLVGNPAQKEDWWTPPKAEKPLTFIDFARSEGRFEQTLTTDQDNGIIFETPEGASPDQVRQRRLLQKTEKAFLHPAPFLVRAAVVQVRALPCAAEEAPALRPLAVKQFHDFTQPDVSRFAPQAVAATASSRCIDDPRVTKHPQHLGKIVRGNSRRPGEVLAQNRLAFFQ